MSRRSAAAKSGVLQWLVALLRSLVKAVIRSFIGGAGWQPNPMRDGMSSDVCTQRYQASFDWSIDEGASEASRLFSVLM